MQRRLAVVIVCAVTGFVAFAIYGQAAQSRQLDADAATIGATCLGGLLERQGDVEGAKAAYQRAIDSGHADYAPMAAECLEQL